MKLIQMKKLISIITVALTLILPILLINSCKKEEPCKNKNCQNGASCVEVAPTYNGAGQQVTATSAYCSCLTGFDGESCETKIVDKIVGTYTGFSACSQTAATWTVEKNGNSTTEFKLGAYIIAHFTNNYDFKIDNQTYVTTNNISVTVYGYGYFQGNKLHTYTHVTAVGQTKECTDDFTKQ